MLFNPDQTRDYATLDRLYGLPIADCEVERPGFYCRLKALLKGKA